MKKLFVVLMFTLLTSSAQAVYLRYCSNPGSSYSSILGYCISDNFRAVSASVDEGLYLRSCYNSGHEGISFMFEQCVNDNFRRIEMALDNSIYLRYCNNYSNDEVNFTFVSCINSNFSRIGSALQ